MKDTKRLSISAMMAAMCVAIMSLGSIVETMDFSLSILAGLIIMILSSEYGNRVAFSVFCVVGILSLLLPIKTPGVYFIALFGWYPIVQKRIQMLKPMLSLVVKLLIFNTGFSATLLVTTFVLGTEDLASWYIYALLFFLGNWCFLLFDILLDRFLIWYILKIRKRLRF